MDSNVYSLWSLQLTKKSKGDKVREDIMAYLIYDIGTGNSRVSIVSEQKEMIGLRTFI